MSWFVKTPLVVVLAVLGGCQDAPSADLSQIDRVLTEHRFYDARSALKAIREDEGPSPETTRRLADIELELGDGYTAERYLNEWRSASGEDPEWITRRAHAYILQGKPRMARDLLDQAKGPMPDEERVAWLRVWAAMEDEDLDRAGQELASGLARFPESAALHARAARLARWQGDWQTAIEHNDEALRLDPKNYEALLLQGEQRIADADMEGALASYRLAAKTYPDFAVPPANVAGILLDLKRPKEAQKVLAPALARNPGFPLLQFNAARLDASRGRWKEARATLQGMPMQFKRDFPAAIVLEGQVEAKLGNQGTARALLMSVAGKPGVGAQATELLDELDAAG